MKIYYYFSVHEPLYHRVTLELQDAYGLESAGGFVYGHDQRRFLEGTGFPWNRLDVYSDWVREVGSWNLDEAFLAEAEHKYGQPNLALMVYGERHVHLAYEDTLKLCEIIVRHAERIFSEDPPDVFVMESVADLVSYLLYGVAKHRGVPCLLVESGRIPGRAAVYGNAHQRWEGLEAAFERMRDKPLEESARASAQAFLDDFRKRRPRPSQMGPRFVPTVGTRDFSRLKDAFGRLREDPDNPIRIGTLQMIGQRAMRIVRHRATRLRGDFEVPPEGEKYFLFPLHFQPEATTLICGPYYMNQVALVEDIAKSLPVGYRLYVKEHFASIGRRPLSDYRRMKSLWNVRLVDPGLDSFELARRAAAVVTITGTMGWEALLLGRPVIAFGEAFYCAYPGVVHAGRRAKGEWPALFREVVERTGPDHELLLKFVAAMLASTKECRLSLDHPRLNPSVLEPENVSALAAILASAMGLTRSAPEPVVAAAQK